MNYLHKYEYPTNLAMTVLKKNSPYDLPIRGKALKKAVTFVTREYLSDDERNLIYLLYIKGRTIAQMQVEFAENGIDLSKGQLSRKKQNLLQKLRHPSIIEYFKKGGYAYKDEHRSRKKNGTPIDVLGLSFRAYGCLQRANFTTIERLIDFLDKDGDLLSIKNLGHKTADEIISKVSYLRESLGK